MRLFEAAKTGDPATKQNAIMTLKFMKEQGVLLALKDEQGETGATPVRFAFGPAAPAITDELVEAITRRVVERLAPDAVRDVVADVVKEISEKLIREEIARLRKPKA